MNELKTINQLTLKAEGDVIKALGTVYGVVDSYGDRSQAGVFAGATPKSVRFIFNHDFGSVPTAVITALYDIGRADLPAVVRDAHPTATGGAVVERRYLTNPRAQEIKEAVLSGAITDMSYGFNAEQIAYTKLPNGDSVRELLRVDLFEFSDVALRGAVPGTMANMAAKAGYTYAGGLQLRAGARHSARDTELLNGIASAAHELGATNISVTNDNSGGKAPSAAAVLRKAERFLDETDPGWEFERIAARLRRQGLR